jgi:hypothetical protein
MLLQARKAVTIKPTPELVVVQGIDHDITCDGIGHRRFQVAFARVLDVLATGLPDARIFVGSQFGSVPTYIKALTLKQRINQRLRISPGRGPCAFLDARGAAIPKGVAYLEAVIHRYEAAVATACKAVAACRYDGGAFGRVVERPEYISWDVIHLSGRGQAKAAAVAWAALKRVGSFRAPAKFAVVLRSPLRGPGVGPGTRPEKPLARAKAAAADEGRAERGYGFRDPRTIMTRLVTPHTTMIVTTTLTMLIRRTAASTSSSRRRRVWRFMGRVSRRAGRAALEPSRARKELNERLYEIW